MTAADDGVQPPASERGKRLSVVIVGVGLVLLLACAVGVALMLMGVAPFAQLPPQVVSVIGVGILFAASMILGGTLNLIRLFLMSRASRQRDVLYAKRDANPLA